jgi:hypothetical protein
MQIGLLYSARVRSKHSKTTMSNERRFIHASFVFSIVCSFYFSIFPSYSMIPNIQQERADGPTISNSTLMSTMLPAMKDDSHPQQQPQQQQQKQQKQQWWKRYVQDIARPFPYWKGEKYSWCLSKPDAGKKKTLGLVFVKNYKAASSTGKGISMRIVHNVAVAKKQLAAAAARNATPIDAAISKKNLAAATAGNATRDADSCATFTKHGPLFREKKHTLLWSNVRDPAKRSVSRFFHFKVSRRSVNATTQNMVRHLRQEIGFQVDYLRTKKPKKDKSKNNKTTLQFVQIIKEEIIDAFDFIALVERMDESLVVMKLLFDLDDKDMIVLSAKSSGGYDDGMFQEKCFLIQKSVTTPEVDEFLATDFKVDNADYLLYAAANRSLDLTIDALGRKRVEEHVRQHRMLQKLAEEQCLAHAVFPCSANGTRQLEMSALDCYDGDSGCGFRCVDRVIQEYYEGSSN